MEEPELIRSDSDSSSESVDHSSLAADVVSDEERVGYEWELWRANKIIQGLNSSLTFAENQWVSDVNQLQQQIQQRDQVISSHSTNMFLRGMTLIEKKVKAKQTNAQQLKDLLHKSKQYEEDIVGKRSPSLQEVSEPNSQEAYAMFSDVMEFSDSQLDDMTYDEKTGLKRVARQYKALERKEDWYKDEILVEIGALR